MTYSVWQATIQDDSGNVVEAAQITVKDEATGLDAELFSTNTGTPKINPFLTGIDGFAQFYTSGGEYRIDAIDAGSGLNRTLRNVRIGSAGAVDAGIDQDEIELNSDKSFQSFDSLTSAIAFVTANPDTIERLSTASKLSEAECVTAGIQYPDGDSSDYVVVSAGTEVDDGVNFIDAGTKQLKLDREKGGQRLISLVDKKTSLRMATASSRKYPVVMEAGREGVELFLFGDGATSIETGIRLIPSPVDHFDIEVSILSEPVDTFSTLISQNISSVAEDREFQVYHEKNNDRFRIYIGGNQYDHTVEAVGALKNTRWRFRMSGGEDVLTVLKDGIVILNEQAGFDGSKTEPTATTTMASRHNGSLVSYANGSSTVFSDFVIHDKPPKIVILGASIMNGAFNVPKESVTYNHSINSNMGDLVEYATNGDTVTDTLAALPSILAAETEPALFIMHIGGNDVTETRPYSSAAINRLDTLENGLIDLITQVKAAGHDFALTNLTYRNYTNILPDGSNGSLPYNANIHEPIIRELTPEWWGFETDLPVLNLYQWAFDNQALMQPDGVHYTAAGYDALREHILDKVKANYSDSVGRVSMKLSGGSESSEPFVYSDGSSALATLNNYTYKNWFAGVNGVPLSVFSPLTSESIGSQLLLKNTTGGVITANAVVPGTSLSQVFFDAAGLLAVSADALPTGSSWQLLNGGSVPIDAAKTFIRVS